MTGILGGKPQQPQVNITRVTVVLDRGADAGPHPLVQAGPPVLLAQRRRSVPLKYQEAEVELPFYWAVVIVDILVLQTTQTPCVLGLPFFIVT